MGFILPVTLLIDDDVVKSAAANPAIALWLQSTRLAGRVAELGVVRHLLCESSTLAYTSWRTFMRANCSLE